MKRIVKNIVLLFGAALSLSACEGDIVFYATEVTPVTSEGEVISYHEEKTPITSCDRISYTNFKRLDSHADLFYQDGFKNVFTTYEEAMEYKNVLIDKLETNIDMGKAEQDYDYLVTINYLNSLTPSMFEKKNLFISNSRREMSYNKDSCRLENIYLKDDILYIHLYRDYMYKGMSKYYQCYTFFINKTISFTSYKIETTDLFKY